MPASQRPDRFGDNASAKARLTTTARPPAPYAEDLQRIGLALGLGALGLRCGFGSCSLAFLCSAVRTLTGGASARTISSRPAVSEPEFGRPHCS
jgi:hypothetical protein